VETLPKTAQPFALFLAERQVPTNRAGDGIDGEEV
tara:strand:- start:278 stop:382 length:105 start_codon:yes stop_codon:yes gene_type:complete